MEILHLDWVWIPHGLISATGSTVSQCVVTTNIGRCVVNNSHEAVLKLHGIYKIVLYRV